MFCRSFSFVVSVFFIAQLAFAQNTQLKIPHNHAAMEGGTVLMMGDDHFELRAPKQDKVLQIWASDKLRDPVAIDQFSELSVVLVDGNNKRVLENKSSDQPSMFTVQLPSQYSENSRIELFAKRKNPPRNHVPASTAQNITLKEIFSKTSKDPHAGHTK